MGGHGYEGRETEEKIGDKRTGGDSTTYIL